MQGAIQFIRLSTSTLPEKLCSTYGVVFSHYLSVQFRVRRLNRVVAALLKEVRPETQICIKIRVLSVFRAVLHH